VILKEAGYEVTILNRSSKRLERFKAEGFKTYTFEDFSAQPYDLIINMTSAGLEDDFLPCPQYILAEIIPTADACIDVIYGKETPFLKLAKLYHKPTKDGSDMLLYQGIIAFEYFTKHAYTFDEIKTHMQKAFTL
jgi:shikimate dehydrogenase